MRTRNHPTDGRMGSGHARHTVFTSLSKVALAVSALATVVVPTLALSGSASAGAPSAPGLGPILSYLAGLVPAVAPVTASSAVQEVGPSTLPVLAPPAPRPPLRLSRPTLSRTSQCRWISM